VKRIKCSNAKCDGVFAHQLGSKTIDIGRQKQHFTVVGADFNIMGTCGKCGQKTTLFVEDNKVVEDDVEYMDDGQLTPEEQEQLEKDKLKQRGDDLDTEEKGLKPGDEPEPELDEDGNPKPPEITMQLIQKRTDAAPAPRA
jgi:hypothetical protein